MGEGKPRDLPAIFQARIKVKVCDKYRFFHFIKQALFLCNKIPYSVKFFNFHMGA